MKIKYDKVWLIGVTLIFLLLGSFVVYLSINRIRGINNCTYNNVSYENNQYVQGYKAGFDCKCENGNIVCFDSTANIVKPTIDKFVRTNLKVTPKYISLGTKEGVSGLPLKTKFVSISSKTDKLNIIVEQEQKCSEDLRVPVQFGMYYLSENRLYLTNIINRAPNLYTQDCIASVTYDFSNWKYKGDDLKIIYMSEQGEEYEASVCNYDSKIYFDGDTYSSVDKCNICKCINGISKCGNDRVCTQSNN